MSSFTKCLNLDNIALPLISLVEIYMCFILFSFICVFFFMYVYMYFPIQVFIGKNAEIFNIRGCMNYFSAELYFEICIIVFIACFKKNNFCFCYIECNFISMKPKGKFSKVFIQSFVNGTYTVLDVQKTCIIGKMKTGKSNRIVQKEKQRTKN